MTMMAVASRRVATTTLPTRPTTTGTRLVVAVSLLLAFAPWTIRACFHPLTSSFVCHHRKPPRSGSSPCGRRRWQDLNFHQHHHPSSSSSSSSWSILFRQGTTRTSNNIAAVRLHQQDWNGSDGENGAAVGADAKCSSEPADGIQPTQLPTQTTPAPPQLDSLEQFERDVTKVLKELRADDHDPTLPPYFRHREAKLPAFTYTWTHKDWERHTSRTRYLEWATNLFTSRLLRRVFPQFLFLMAWTAILVVTKSPGTFWLLNHVTIDLTPLSLISTFVGFLLTLRSNQGLERLGQGRLAFGEMVLYTRDMAHVIASEIQPRHGQVGLLLARYVSLFGWLLKRNMRGDAVNGTDEDIIRVMLPDDRDARFVLDARKKPTAVVQRLRQVFAHLRRQGALDGAVQHGLDQKTRSLNHCIMTCERILASPIPPLYTAHAGRLLVFYLLCLPLGLRSLRLGKVGTLVTTGVVGYAMLGLDEVSHLLEQPFRLMPLWHLSKNSMLDVADAFCVPPPPLLDQQLNDDYVGAANTATDMDRNGGRKHDPSYWPAAR